MLITPNTNIQNKNTEHLPDSGSPKPHIHLISSNLISSYFVIQHLPAEIKVTTMYPDEDVIKCVQQSKPNLVILTVESNFRESILLIEQLKYRMGTQHIPVILTVEKLSSEFEMQAYRAGAFDVISLPFNRDAFSFKIRNFLGCFEKIKARNHLDSITKISELPVSSADETLLEHTIEAINKHIDEVDLSVIKLSEYIGWSYNFLYRRIKKITGYTVKQFIKNHRIEVAAKLLSQSNQNISETMYKVGFTSASYFTRCFREQKGCTPSEYVQNRNDMASRSVHLGFQAVSLPLSVERKKRTRASI